MNLIPLVKMLLLSHLLISKRRIDLWKTVRQGLRSGQRRNENNSQDHTNGGCKCKCRNRHFKPPFRKQWFQANCGQVAPTSPMPGNSLKLSRKIKQRKSIYLLFIFIYQLSIYLIFRTSKRSAITLRHDAIAQRLSRS